jgi:hypothetical protein
MLQAEPINLLQSRFSSMGGQVSCFVGNTAVAVIDFVGNTAVAVIELGNGKCAMD